MARRRSLLQHAVMTCLLLTLLFCNTVTAEFTDGGVVHTVFLWLKKPGNQQDRERLLIATDRLRAIPGVQEIRFGEVIESSRDAVDDSFDVGVYFYFSDIAAMNHYLVHPLHRRVVEQEIKPVVERLVVHDFNDTKTR
ncbi:MAG: Dabb family protein [Gammaproteobacteria bacterium]